MPRRLRIEYEDAIYHVMARGNARQDIVHDDDDRRRLLADLERAVERSGWLVLGFVLMTNHFHLLLRTPRPNLARGMQAFLSGYAAWAARHRRRPGHLFQGRYKAEMIEDESYYWTVSRYIHLNPVHAGLVARPEDWEWSSYPGYFRATRRRPWVAHQALLDAWRGENGANDPAAAYRRFTEEGMAAPPPSPFREAFGGWALGSTRFVDRLRSLAGPATAGSPAPEARQLAGRFGLSRADSVPNLTRRVEVRLPKSPDLAAELGQILGMLAGGGAPSRAHGEILPAVREDHQGQATKIQA